MLPSILTTFLFAASGICGRRAALAFGSLRGNLLRLTLSMLFLGLAAGGLTGLSWGMQSTHRLLLSGAVGFGIGDVALFLAYPRLGARRTLLLNLCSAPVFGALADWWLVGSRVTPLQILASMVILAGVSLALLGRSSSSSEATASRRTLAWGCTFALLAGLGQGSGAALTRFAQAAMLAEGHLLLPVQQAFVRTIPGVLVSAAIWAGAATLGRRWQARQGAVIPQPYPTPPMPHRWWWLLGAALFGPTVGVTCFQWALSEAPTAVVLSIIAATPIVIIPLTAIFEGDRPGRLAIVGSCVGVAGVILMTWVTRR